MQERVFIRDKRWKGMKVDGRWSGRGMSALNDAEGPAKGAEQGISGRGKSQ